MLRPRQRSRPLDEWTLSNNSAVGALGHHRLGAARPRGSRP